MHSQSSESRALYTTSLPCLLLLTRLFFINLLIYLRIVLSCTELNLLMTSRWVLGILLDPMYRRISDSMPLPTTIGLLDVKSRLYSNNFFSSFSFLTNWLMPTIVHLPPTFVQYRPLYFLHSLC